MDIYEVREGMIQQAPTETGMYAADLPRLRLASSISFDL